MLRLGSTEISRLSGPVTFHYLIPKERSFRKQAERGIYLPIIILLGDTHNSEDERCRECDEKKGCYLIESESFLNEINKIAREYPIDVYAEHAPEKKLNSNKGVLANFVRKTLGCYKKNSYCEYPAPRWHGADARFWEGKAENIATDVLTYFKFLNNNSLVLVDRHERVPIELYHSDKKLDGLDLFKEFMEEFIEKINEPVENLATKLPVLIKDLIHSNEKSIIQKQLNKYKLDLNVQLYSYRSLLKFWKDILHRTLSEICRETIPSRNPPEFYIKNLRNYMIKGVRVPDELDTHLRYLQLISNIWTTFTACFLDMYFISRMLKPPKGNTNSYLTIGFFGRNHCFTISGLLCFGEMDWYNLRFFKDPGGKCISTEDDGEIDLNQDLINYAKLRNEVIKNES